MSSRIYFDRVAGAWDDMRAGFFSERVREGALEAAGARAGERALDVGAGTGFVTEALLGRGLEVVAVDESPEMLRRLEAKLDRRGHLQTRLGVAERLPVHDGEVDRVFANMVLHHVEDPALAVAEMARALRPGGRLAITDLDLHRHRFLLEEHHDRWPGFDRAEVRRWLEQAGLEEASVGCADASCCAASSTGADQARVSIFLATGRKGGGGDGQRRACC